MNGENNEAGTEMMSRELINRPNGNQHVSRAGVTLLMVLSLIVLFLLMGTSFLLLANQFRRSATTVGMIQVRRDDSRSLVNRAFYDLLRGVDLDNSRSPLRGHSLLEDLYGYGIAQGKNKTGNIADSLQASALSASPINNRLWRIRVPNALGASFRGDLTGQTEGLVQLHDFYNAGTLSITHFYDMPVVLGNSAISGKIIDFEYDDTASPPVYVFDVVFSWEDSSSAFATISIQQFRRTD
ncbi:MAG: hypothetical protein R3C03_15795 [Pirellulaceae bacterium]